MFCLLVQVLASDGLWDTVNSQQCATFIKQELKKDPGMGADELANAMVKRAIRFRTQDNVAVVVVDLRQATSSIWLFGFGKIQFWIWLWR